MNKDLVEKLHLKLKEEYLNYVNNIKQLPVEEIIKKSYELTIRKEFVDMFYDNRDFNKFQLLALLEKEQPLQYLYDSWMDCDYGINNLLLDNLDNTFYELGNDYENKVMLKIQKDKNYSLIESISDVLQAFDNYDFCTYLKQKFNFLKIFNIC